jgi:arsenate reductase
MLTIYHNPRCSKSREALELLEAENIPHKVRLYLSEPLTRNELRALLKKLGMKASEILRRSEPYFKETLKDQFLTESQMLDELTAHPALVERPIVASETAAVVARPAQKLRDLQ